MILSVTSFDSGYICNGIIGGCKLFTSVEKALAFIITIVLTFDSNKLGGFYRNPLVAIDLAKVL
jgi:hypothetical protein